VRFADTSFWIAFLLRRETHHEMAATLWLADATPVLTSELVLGETWTFLNRRDGHAFAVRFLDLVAASPRVSVVGVESRTIRGAWTWLRKHDERPYSLVDATSFEIMRSRRLREALAFDGDFTAAGFLEVRSAS
jgi:predicted nucleic acid-binding protein